MEGGPNFWGIERYLTPPTTDTTKKDRGLGGVHNGVPIGRETPYKDHLEDLWGDAS